MIQPGDVALHTGDDFYARAIQWATHSKWSHVGLVVEVNTVGLVIVEATQRGLLLTQLTPTSAGWSFRNSNLTPEGRGLAVAWSLKKQAAHDPYNFVDIFFIGIHLLLPWWKLVVEGTGRYFCSEATATALIHGGADIDAPELTSPADLDKLYPTVS